VNEAFGFAGLTSPSGSYKLTWGRRGGGVTVPPDPPSGTEFTTAEYAQIAASGDGSSFTLQSTGGGQRPWVMIEIPLFTWGGVWEQNVFWDVVFRAYARTGSGMQGWSYDCRLYTWKPGTGWVQDDAHTGSTWANLESHHLLDDASQYVTADRKLYVAVINDDPSSGSPVPATAFLYVDWVAFAIANVEARLE